ncbi:MAG: sensor histidine kinase [Novosphingobium sp.]|uniref:sensor histidine kinase n=1 Tax=Novosphingobium sp. TaxID=1874826 RepID=UPI003C7D881A
MADASKHRASAADAALGWRAVAVLLLGLIFAAVLAAMGPDPAATGLVAVAPQRIVLMESGEQHQARHPSAADWTLTFADQSRFGSEVARQHAKGLGSAKVSPDERQWHFELSPAESAGAPLALFIANASGDLALHVNGARVADSTAQPAYFGPGIGTSSLAAPLPMVDLHRTADRIDVVQSGDQAQIGIRAIYLGSPRAAQTARLSFGRWLDRQRLAAAFAAAAGLCGVLVLLAGQQRRAAGAIALLVAGQGLDLLGAESSVPLSVIKAALALAAGGALVWLYRRPRGWAAIMVLAGCIPLILGALAALALALTDWFVLAPWAVLQIANDGPRPVLLFGAPLLVWHEGRLMLERLRAVRSEMARKDEIIAAQQQALDTEIRNAAILEERQRFARDMHDGIGGHLQALLMRVRAGRIQSGEIASELQGGLADLRLMVDSLDQIDAGLGQALDNFRLRAGPQLEAAGIALEWRRSGPLDTARLDPRATLSLYRMLQEAITNCVRHSGAGKVELVADLDQAGRTLTIEIADNGCGFDPAAVRAGKGLGNLRKRALKLGGTADLVSAAGSGTRIVLRIPVAPHPS